MQKVESADGKPYNRNYEYGYCTCAKSGCRMQIRYRAENGQYRPKYCSEHLAEEIERIRNSGKSEIEAKEATHVKITGVEVRTLQQSIEG